MRPLLSSVLAFLGLLLAVSHAALIPKADFKWVNAWTNMPQLVETNNLPPAPFTSSSSVFRDTTVRQTLRMTLTSDKIRIVFSNTFGGTDLPITSAFVSLPQGGSSGVSGTLASPVLPITFNGGATSVTVPRGQTFTSDELAFPVKAQQVITVTLYLQQGQQGNNVDGHPGSRTTSWVVNGNYAKDTTLSGATAVVHWYLLSSVQAWVPLQTSSLVILGDSITDGRGSIDNQNNRWTDLLFNRLQQSGLTDIAVNNQAAGGNRVLADGLGPSLISRYTRDAINQPGVKWVLVFEGVNDIGTAGTDQATQTQVGDQLIAAFKQIAADVKKAGYKIWGATITPFSSPNNSGGGYSNAVREATRQRVNNWILTSGTYDAVIDFDKFLRSASSPSQLDSRYDSGDYLHPNVAGYQHLADSFPLELFGSSSPGPTTAPPTSTSTPTTTPTQSPTTTIPFPGPTQTKYGQCGGRGYTGPTQCAVGLICQVISDPWYSQCL